MAQSPFTILGTSRLGVEPRCHACGAGARVSFNWRCANELSSQENLSLISSFAYWKELRRGVLYRCKVCDEVWHLDGNAEELTHVQPERLSLVLDWNREPIPLLPSISDALERIGPTPPDLYGNGKERRVTPCKVISRSGESFEMAMVCFQQDAPVQDHMHFRLGSEIAKITESPFALPLSVREASSRAEEMRMGFSPTLIEMLDGKRFVLNGMTSFMAMHGYSASDARVVNSSYFSEHPAPSFVEPPTQVTFFIVDGDPRWTIGRPADAVPTLVQKSWWKSLLGL
jgi:hypothetical protein